MKPEIEALNLFKELIIKDCTKEEVVFFTVSKLTIRLHEYTDKLKKRFILSSSVTLSITLFITIVGTDFKFFLGIEPYDWKLIFKIALCITSFISLYNLIPVLKEWAKNKSDDEFITEFIQKLTQKSKVEIISTKNHKVNKSRKTTGYNQEQVITIPKNTTKEQLVSLKQTFEANPGNGKITLLFPERDKYVQIRQMVDLNNKVLAKIDEILELPF